MSMTIQNIEPDEIVKEYHSDLVAFMEAHFKAASQDDSKPVDTVGFLMTRIRIMLGSSIEEMKEQGERRFGDPDLADRIKALLAKATGWTVGTLSGLGTHAAAKLMRDQYLFLNGVSLGYSMLYTTEVGAKGESVYSATLLEHLKGWNELIVDFNRSLPAVVLETLNREEDGIDQARAVEITKKLQETWAGIGG